MEVEAAQASELRCAKPLGGTPDMPGGSEPTEEVRAEWNAMRRVGDG